ncbi:SNF2 family N-terminal domain-containing protein [Xylariales sp. AK1849]|nr:SNF2 family N-terminal domain-containing protein [Xylariales sp. AK1849]
MALSLKRLLNDEEPSPDEFRRRVDNGYGSIGYRPDESLNDSFIDVLNHTLDDRLVQDNPTPESSGLEGADHVPFDVAADLQEWANNFTPAEQYNRSPLAESDIGASSASTQEDRNGTGLAHGVKPSDVCFGMIHNVDVKVIGDMSVLDAKLKPTHGLTLTQRFHLKDKTDHILLSFLDETEFGYLRANMTKGLGEMLAVPALYFEAVVGTDALRETIGRAQKPSEALVRVNINIYGLLSEADTVGSQLSFHKLWLQKPDNAIRDVTYKNPQVLEFEGIDSSMLEKPSELLERGRPKPRTEEHHLRQTVTEVYNASKRQDGLVQITVSGRFKTIMLRHQREALDFMIQRETGEIPDRFRLWKKVVVEGVTSYLHSITKSKARIQPEEKGGGILADEMGMGKSLSILSLIVETLEEGQIWAAKRKSMEESGQLKGHTRSTLVVVSSALLINNWCKEIEEHLEDSLTVIRYHGSDRPKDQSGLATLEDSDVVITTYNTLAKEFSDRLSFGKASLLHDIEWYRVVLDEAHIIRRQATSFHRTCAELKANSRWCLTGTPIQNKLEDIGALFCFIKAKPFDSMAVFRRYIVVPFDQNEDETAIERLVQLNDSLCLRRTKELLDLPDLNERVRRLDLNEEERKQYENTAKILYRKIRQKAGEHEQTSKFGIFQANLQLRIMCNHGTFQQPFSWQSERSLRDTKEAVISALGGNAQVNCDGCSQPMPVLGSNKVYNEFVERCNHVLCSECLEDTLNRGPAVGRRHCPLCKRFGTETVDVEMADGSQDPRSNDGELDDAHYFRSGGYSTKMNRLILDVQQDLDKTKSIIFSCWTRTLNLVAKHLERANIPYSRIDGECPLSKRQKILDDFAKKSGNPVLIMTTGTGAFGLNLTCANRVFIVELQWNPSVESQAIARAIRLGQDQHVSVIRYIVNNTVEQDMQSQQQRKLMMAQKGFDEGMEIDD